MDRLNSKTVSVFTPPLSRFALLLISRLVFSNGSFHIDATGHPAVVFHSRAESDFAAETRNSALSARGCFPFLYFRPFGGSNVGMQPLAPVRLNDLQTTRGQTMLPNAAKRWFKSQGPGEILVSASERTRRSESSLGVPRKQNGGERRARLGIRAVKRSSARENKGAEEGYGTSSSSSK